MSLLRAQVLEAGHDVCNFSRNALPPLPHRPSMNAEDATSPLSLSRAIPESGKASSHTNTSTASNSIDFDHFDNDNSVDMPSERFGRSDPKPFESDHGPGLQLRRVSHISKHAYVHELQRGRRCFDVFWDVVFIDAHENPQYGTIHAFTRTEEDAVAEEGEHKENKEYPCIYKRAYWYRRFVFISCV